MLFYSDLHIRPDRIVDAKRVLDTINYCAKKFDIDYIVNCGDTFHTRGLIKTSCFDVIQQSYDKWAREGLKQIILVGNHDQEDKIGEIHPMKVFGNYKGWYVVDSPMCLPESTDIVLWPYSNNLSKEDIESFILFEHSSHTLITHWGIEGAKRNDSNIDTNGVPLSWIKPFKRVFSGHYHYRNEISNVQYIGSPMQQDFGEMGQDKGLIIWDSETDDLKFLKIDGTMEHKEMIVSLSADGVEKELTYGDIKSTDAVRVVIKGDEELVKSFDIATLGIVAKSIKPDRKINEKSFSRLNIKKEDIYDVAKLMNEYVGHIETSLSKERIMQIGMEIIK